MKKYTTKSSKKPTLRGRAETKLKQHKKEDRPAADTDLRRLLHELQVHQVELEMQNEELRRAQQELEASRRKYVDLYDFAPVGYFTLDNKGTILDANLTGTVMLGKERGLLLNQPFPLFVAPDSQDLFHQYQRQVFSSTEKKTCEIKMMTQDGKEFIGCLESIALEHKEAAGTCSVAVIDITARRQADQALRESEEKYRTLVERANDGIIIVQDTIVKFANQRMAELDGSSVEQIVGSPFTDHVHPDELPRLMENYQRRMAGEDIPAVYETVLKRRDGSTVPSELNCGVIMYQGKPAELILVRDITERKLAEQSLRQSEGKLRGVIEGSIDGIYLVNEQGLIIEWNRGAENMTMLPRDKALGRPIWEVFIEYWPEEKNIPDVYEALKQKTLESLKTGKSPWINKLNEHTIRLPDKSARIIQEYTFPIPSEQGFILGTVSRDITETKKIEDQLSQSQKMESIGTLAGGIAHDFNNILAAIMGNTEMALQILPEYSTAHKHLEQVLKSSERARNLVKQILAFSRKSEEDREPLEIKKAVLEVIKMLRSTLPATIEMRENITSEVWIMGSVIQMHQVLLNLCTNAFHAMREKGGVLGIELSDVNIDAGDINEPNDMLSGDYVKLSVIDTGTGIAPEIMNRIFDPFFTTKGVGEGTGMGLSVVYGIVKSHGGDITVESELGKGTSFHILLPRIEGKAAEKEHVEQPVPRGTERILLVDDEEIIVDVGQKMLEMLGYRVTGARNAAEALEIFRKGPDTFDLVISDYTMPKMDGYELAQKLLAVRPDMPIIMNTGYNETISQEKALAAGIREFLLKPLNLRKLGEAVRRVLDGKAIGNRQ